ncbi:exonuclease 3'-5' domain-containing protein 2-like [Sitodiplosis mosellana]|uniref:exonuclease 3'-5' domain-containing protein 2-like n=1 Tax=Sitodiplosis mosellana TaxID=263140 RepID=UPI002444BE1E|nr:exonuclease 3'-5' domain-containing protein 2-like [Sitodiplosis mosellana]
MAKDEGAILVGSLIAAGSACFIIYGVFKAIKAVISVLCPELVPSVLPPFRGTVQYANIRVIDCNTASSRRIIKELKSHCDEFPVMGFDCEWENIMYERGRVALLQLQSYRGLCVLIRLRRIGTIPSELKEILENDKIIKVGVAPDTDARYLYEDYGFNVRSTYDLRYMAASAGRRPGTLANMSEAYLFLKLQKGSDKALHFDWNAPYLSEKQIEYAAKDAHAGIELFKFFAKKLERVDSFWSEQGHVKGVITKRCSKFLNKYYNGAQGIPDEINW